MRVAARENGDLEATTGGPTRAEHLALGVALVVLALVAANRLDSTALWADEAWSLAATNDLTGSLRATSGTMGAYYATLWLWAQVSTTTPWLRALSTVFAAGTLVVVQAVARRIGGSRLAIVAPLLLVCSPMFLWVATEARGYAMETLVVSVAWYAACRIDRPGRSGWGRRGWLGVFFVCAVVGPLAHGLFIAQLIGIGVWVSIGRGARTRLVAFAPGMLATVLVTFALWQAGLSSAGAVHVGSAMELFTSWRSWYFAAPSVLAALLGVLLLVGIGADARGFARERGLRPPHLHLVASVWFAVPLGVLLVVREFHTIWAPYYLSPITPGVALLIGGGLIALARPRRTTRSTAGRRNAILYAGAGIVLVACTFVNLTEPRRPNEDWRAAARLVATAAHPGDGILFSGSDPANPVESRAGFEAAWREVGHEHTPAPLSPPRPLGEVRRTETFLRPQAAAEAALRFRRVWTVDYDDVLHREGIVDRSPFEQRFSRVDSWTFRGNIRVDLYERRPSSGRSPTP